MIVAGLLLLYYDGTSYTTISLVGSLIILIGLLTLGALLVSILAISLSARTIAKSHQKQITLREKIEAEENLDRIDDEIKEPLNQLKD
jgi:hypothetical protein